MKKFNFMDVISIIIVIFIAQFLPTFENWFLFELEKNKVTNIDHKKVVVFFDNFDDEHGKLVVEIFKSRLKSKEDSINDYKILKINSEKTRVSVMQQLVEYLLKDGKTVYLNSSVIPSGGLASLEWSRVYKELLKHNKIVITQAAGNNLNTANFVGEEIDNRFYELLNERKDELKITAINTVDKDIIQAYGFYGKQFIRIKQLLGYGKNNRIRSLVLEVFDDVGAGLEKNKHDMIIDEYSAIVNLFSFAILLSNDNPKVVLVGSSSKIEYDDGKIWDRFLDFRVNYLIDIDEREAGIIGYGDNMKIGTSISSPLVLANLVNQNRYR